MVTKKSYDIFNLVVTVGNTKATLYNNESMTSHVTCNIAMIRFRTGDSLLLAC